ncbi:ketosteroid isomerase-like protein [Halopolyspora algeriensis]|uniref:Ketosteroid isomerase-like protein n=1 Tax=Halopolyspora algeriensis TaxID=1500506 RepID=A0A368VW46_9ACTN|nr:nuclear transport factor 2 family protein [Halopolyspora algeriensis]RCW46063.1 ketosteroid isomerase-like protein [Halopolyspora algeriensis]TQM55470.1 ketosteroid isomerase-like protein [Halopolyspora algeriensis]
MADRDRCAQVRDVVQSWAAAEGSGDAATLRTLLTDDFTGIGPHGFVLDKQQWVARYNAGELVNEEFAVDETAVRTYTSTAIAVGVQNQQATYRGHSVDGSFRLSAVLVDGDRGWSIAHIQLSNLPSR